MNPSRPFILRPIATSLLMAAILLVGIVAYKQLPVSALPEVEQELAPDLLTRLAALIDELAAGPVGEQASQH